MYNLATRCKFIQKNVDSVFQGESFSQSQTDTNAIRGDLSRRKFKYENFYINNNNS